MLDGVPPSISPNIANHIGVAGQHAQTATVNAAASHDDNGDGDGALRSTTAISGFIGGGTLSLVGGGNGGDNHANHRAGQLETRVNCVNNGKHSVEIVEVKSAKGKKKKTCGNVYFGAFRGKRDANGHREVCGENYIHIDRFFLVAMPILFGVFNVIYWTSYGAHFILSANSDPLPKY